MILRPVRPVSPCGPPTTNLPVGLMWKMMLLFQSLRGMTGLMTYSMMSRLAFSVEDGFIVLGRDDHGMNGDGALVDVFNGDLTFAVGAEPGELALEANLS